MNEDIIKIYGDDVTQFYWDNCQKKVLVLQYCDDCKRYQYPPNLVCRDCLSSDLDWKESVGNGEIYSYSVVQKAPSKFFEQFLPYVVALIKLDENIMIESWIVDVDSHDKSRLKIGAKVELSFKEFDEYNLPVFKLC